MPSDELIKVCTSKMKKAFEIFCQELASLRTGRANASMLDIIKVDVYGQKMPINQLATISTPRPKTSQLIFTRFICVFSITMMNLG